MKASISAINIIFTLCSLQAAVSLVLIIRTTLRGYVCISSHNTRGVIGVSSHNTWGIIGVLSHNIAIDA